MAGTRGRSRSSLIDDLERSPGGFELFQAVRLVERIVARAHAVRGRPAPDPVGRSVDPARATLRIRAGTQLAFAAEEVARVRFSGDAPAELTQNVVGLVGSTGTMPHAFSELVQMSVRERNTGLRAFLDLFNDRLAALLYDAFAKYRIEIEAERFPLTRRGTIDDLVRATVGLGGASLHGRLPAPDAAVLHHAGLLSRHAASAHAVERMLSNALGQPVAVEQFVGEWLAVAPAERTRLHAGRAGGDTFCRLGRDAVVGRKVWSVQGLARLCVGPLGYDAFESLLPGGWRQNRLRGLASFALGPDKAFTQRLTLRAAEIPALRVGGPPDGRGASRLGWNTWVGAARPRTRPGVVDLAPTSALNPDNRSAA